MKLDLIKSLLNKLVLRRVKYSQVGIRGIHIDIDCWYREVSEAAIFRGHHPRECDEIKEGQVAWLHVIDRTGMNEVDCMSLGAATKVLFARRHGVMCVRLLRVFLSCC